MARIAYKEWKERKLEEDRINRKMDRMQQRERLINGADGRFQIDPETIEQLRRANAAVNNPGAGEVMLAYGLNKNLKNLRSRPKTAKPQRKVKKQRQHYIPQQPIYHQNQQYQVDEEEDQEDD